MLLYTHTWIPAVYEAISKMPNELPLYDGMTVVDTSTLPEGSVGKVLET